MSDWKLARPRLRARKGADMETLAVAAIALGILAVKGLAVLALSYAGARLAIRHERRT